MSSNTTTTSDNIIFETFEIEFDAGPEPIFHGGELVTGALKIQLKKEIKINAIRIQFNGRAVWKGSSNQKRSEKSLEKVYFNNEFILLERPPGHPLPGHFSWNPNFLYRLPFEFPLPKGCETSYEGPFGFIRYSARAFFEADEPNKARYLVKRLFTIISPPELQKLVPPPMEAISEKKNVRFGSCCCRGRIYAEVQLPKKVYAPGENIIGNFTMDSRTAKSAASEHIETRLIDRLMPIFIGSNGPKETAENKRIKKEGKNEMAQRVVVGRKLTKEDLTNVLENENDKGSNLITTSDVFFIRVPAVIPTLENEQQQSMVPDEPLDVTSEENEKFHRLLESPSTTTLRERKEPFFRIDYALQISIGSQVLLEIPIRVHQIPIFSKGIGFRPFPLSQQVAEPDEVEFIKIGAFTFTPLYPMYLESPKSISNDAENGPSVKNLEEIQILNGESTNTKVIEAGKHAGNVKQQKLNELHRDQNELKQHPLGAMPESTLLRENGQNDSSERRLEENQNKSIYEHTVLVVMNEDSSKTTVQTTEYLLNNGHEDQKQQQNKADSEDQNFEGQQQQHLDISMTG